MLFNNLVRGKHMVDSVPLIASYRVGREVSEASTCVDRGHTEGIRLPCMVFLVRNFVRILQLVLHT
jgi:hypothetical protein